MAQRHLDPRLLDKLLRGEVSPDEARELVWHLVEACPDCARVAELDWALSPDVAADSDSGPVPVRAEDRPRAKDPAISFERIRRRLEGTVTLLARQRAEASGLLEELERHPLERQRLLVRNNGRFQTLPLAELLLDHAWSLGFEEPQRAEVVAELAAELVDWIEPEPFSEEVLNDLRARSWAYRANFRRIRSDFRAAEEAFRRAEALQAEGTGDLLEQARLFSLRASLCRARSHHEEARELLEKAVKIYGVTEETHLAGRTLIEMGAVAFREQRYDQAVERFQRGLEMVDAEQEPRLLFVGHYNMMLCLTEQGRFDEAIALLPKVRRLTVESGSRFDLLRLRWTEGDILRGLGHEARAEAAYLEVRKGFIEEGIAYDAAAVSLTLAALYLRQGRHAEIKQLAAEMVPIFQSRDVHQEAIAALLLFRRAVEMENLTLRMIEEVSEVVRRSQGKPAPPPEQPS